MSNPPRKTKSGIFVRVDRGFGLTAFSPYTGLIFAVPVSHSRTIAKCLDDASIPFPLDSYRLSLGAGWGSNLRDARFPRPFLLPDESYWPAMPSLENPLLVNWLITGRCPLDCEYCYATDLMWDKVQEPQRPDVSRIAESILRLKPLAVVLTGGDPLFSPYLEIALESLRNKAGIIIDTSGYTMSRRHLELFKAYDVVVRISLDSQRPRANEKLRYLHPAYLPSKDNPKSTGEAALDAIIRCLDAGIPVTVQTVATKKNTSELVAFGDRLYRLGIRSWRVFEVVYSWEKREQYRRLVGPFTDEGKRMQGKKARGPYWFVFNEIHKANEQNWEKSIAVQTIFSTSQNSVLLVSADGRFFTASNLNGKKILIDGQHPTAPSAAAIRNVIEMQAHAKRYLNITGPGKEEE